MPQKMEPAHDAILSFVNKKRLPQWQAISLSFCIRMMRFKILQLSQDKAIASPEL